MDSELAALKAKIDRLQSLYFVLFVSSLVLLVARWVVTLPPISFLAWALTLGGAVACRLYRTSLVNKYNALLTRGAPAPMQ